MSGTIKLSELPRKEFLTLLCHKDDIEVINDLPEQYLDITPESTLAMAAKFTERTWTMAKADEDFKMRLRIVFPDLDIVADPRHLSEYPIGYRHVVGLIVCTNMAINTGRMPYWRYPEAYLHPSSQSNLASLAISYKDLFEPPASEATHTTPA